MRYDAATLAARPPLVLDMPWHHRRLVDVIARLRRGSLTVKIATHRPFTMAAPEEGPEASISIKRPAALMRRLFWRGDLGFAEAYLAGEWDTPDLARLLEVLALNLDAYAGTEARSRLAQALIGLRHWGNRNTRVWDNYIGQSMMMIGNAALGVMARTVPQLNVLTVAFPMQIAIGLFALAATLPLVARFVADFEGHYIEVVAPLLRALAPMQGGV